MSFYFRVLSMRPLDPRMSWFQEAAMLMVQPSAIVETGCPIILERNFWM
jgi:hypothetical protein